MMDGAVWVILAATAFVSSHFLLSHPLRRPIVERVGEGVFAGIYSLLAAGMLIWVALAYRSAPRTTLFWTAGDGLWALVSAVMLLASILLMGSMIRNPALPTGGAPGELPETARGVFAITRHPMMWAFALWGVCHIAIYPMTKNIVVCLAVIVLALIGAALQDRKKERLQPDLWPAWEGKTSYMPFAAILASRARLNGFGMHALLGGLVLWLVATWAHIPVSGWAAGIWRWVH
jgi:uncharacterized membrane protein